MNSSADSSDSPLPSSEPATCVLECGLDALLDERLEGLLNHASQQPQQSSVGSTSVDPIRIDGGSRSTSASASRLGMPEQPELLSKLQSIVAQHQFQKPWPGVDERIRNEASANQPPLTGQ